MKRLILLDSHAIIHRAYHALPDFATSKGEPTGGLYGVCTMLFSAIEKLKPDYIVAAYDLPKPTHRHEAYKDYKAGRAKTAGYASSDTVCRQKGGGEHRLSERMVRSQETNPRRKAMAR